MIAAKDDQFDTAKDCFFFFFFFSFFFLFFSLFFLFSYLNPTTTLLHYTFLQLPDSSSRLFSSPFLLLLLHFSVVLYT